MLIKRSEANDTMWDIFLMELETSQSQHLAAICGIAPLKVFYLSLVKTIKKGFYAFKAN